MFSSCSILLDLFHGLLRLCLVPLIHDLPWLCTRLPSAANIINFLTLTDQRETCPPHFSVSHLSYHACSCPSNIQIIRPTFLKCSYRLQIFLLYLSGLVKLKGYDLRSADRRYGVCIALVQMLNFFFLAKSICLLSKTVYTLISSVGLKKIMVKQGVINA